MRLTTDVQGRDEGIKGVGSTHKSNAKKPSAHKEEDNRPATPDREAESQEYSALVARATNDAVRVWDVKTGALSWPQGFEAFFGSSCNDEARTIGFWQQQIHPDDRAKTASSIRDALRSDVEQWTGEYRLAGADGAYRDVLERAVIARDEKGTARQFVGSLMDITARKHLQDQVCRAQRMEAFGQLAGGVAHDFNNFLTTILGYSDLLLEELKLKGHVASHITEIRSAASRASALTGQLMAFSRKSVLMAQVLEVNTLITNLERSLLRLLGENIRVCCELHDLKQAAHIQADPGDLGQVILNIAVNARDAMPDGGELRIVTAVEHLNPELVHTFNWESFTAGDYVTIAVSDSGCGMTDEVKRRLFEPFFTTKHAGGGSGLGLATSFGIVRQSGGHIGVVSELGLGTTVTIYLPKVPAPPSMRKPAAKNLPPGTETVLVLEDDVSVRHISVRVLRSLGYDVIEAANGDDAQRLITARGARQIHLLLTDVMMPEMSGHDFAAWLEKTSPQTKVIFVSGYLDQSLQFAQHCDQAMYFLPKPFDPEQLARKVRHALDTAA